MRIMVAHSLVFALICSVLGGCAASRIAPRAHELLEGQGGQRSLKPDVHSPSEKDHDLNDDRHEEVDGSSLLEKSQGLKSSVVGNETNDAPGTQYGEAPWQQEDGGSSLLEKSHAAPRAKGVSMLEKSQVNSTQSLTLSVKQKTAFLLRKISSAIWRPLHAASDHHLLVVVGISGSLAILVLLSFCISSYSSSKKKTKGNVKKSFCFDECSGERKQHMFNGKVIYEWDQSATVVTLYVDIPKEMTKQDLEIKILPTKVQIGRKGKVPFMKQETWQKVKDQESGWRLRSSGELQIYLQKAEKGDWLHALNHKSSDERNRHLHTEQANPLKRITEVDEDYDIAATGSGISFDEK